MSVDIATKYCIDMSPVREFEAMFGQQLPDILEPLRQVDADFEQIKASLGHYQKIADELEAVQTDLTRTRTELAWQGAAGDSSRSAIDWMLLVLGWIGAVILFVVAALLMLVALLLYAIGEIMAFLGDAIAWISAVAVTVAAIIGILRAAGKGGGGYLASIWKTAMEVFSKTLMATMGIIGAAGDALGWICEQAAKAVMWLALWLVEVGGKWSGTPPEDMKSIRERREELFGAKKD